MPIGLQFFRTPAAVLKNERELIPSSQRTENKYSKYSIISTCLNEKRLRLLFEIPGEIKAMKLK